MGRVPDHIFVVDEDRCFGCAACVALCPVDALRLEGVMVYVDDRVVHIASSVYQPARFLRWIL